MKISQVALERMQESGNGGSILDVMDLDLVLYRRPGIAGYFPQV